MYSKTVITYIPTSNPEVKSVIFRDNRPIETNFKGKSFLRFIYPEFKKDLHILRHDFTFAKEAYNNKFACNKAL